VSRVMPGYGGARKGKVVHARRRWCSAKALSVAGQMRVGTLRMGPCHRFHVQNMHLFHRNACVCIGGSMRSARMSACTHERVGVDVWRMQVRTEAQARNSIMHNTERMVAQQ
jgi:hypothetical protein